MITIRQNSDIFKAFENNEIQHLAHGANCWSTMGAGIAGMIRSRYPEAFQADCEYELNPEQRIGRFSSAVLNDGSVIHNLYTQFYPGPNAHIDFIISALTLCLEEIAEEMEPDTEVNFGMPAIGCGIGGVSFYQMFKAVQKVSDQISLDYPGRKINIFIFTLGDQFNQSIDIILSERG